MAIETSKTFKKIPTLRDEWIKVFEHIDMVGGISLTINDCKEIADLLKEKPTPPEKIITYLMRVRMQRYSGFKCMTLNNEELWVFKKSDILKIGENI